MEEFKKFIRKMPKLKEAVYHEQLTWQKIYEIYDLYGPDDDFWLKYKEDADKINIVQTNKVEEQKEPVIEKPIQETTTQTTNEVKSSSNDSVDWATLLEYAKKIDVDKLTSGIDSLQKILGIVGTLISEDNTKKQPKKARQVFQKFND